MDAEVFAEWLTRQGHKVYKTDSSYWYNAAPGILQAFPYHWTINPGRKELRSLLLSHGAIALRYSAPINSKPGKISYHSVLKDCYDIDLLHKKTRNGIRKGLKNFNIEKISFEKLASEGWELQKDTLLRQNRQDSMDRTRWEKLCLSACNLPGFEVFAACNSSQIAAAAIVSHIDDHYYVPFAMSRSCYLGKHVNNALFYSLACELLKRKDAAGIFFSVESLDAPPNVDQFKWRMGFFPKPVRQLVEINPVIKPFIRAPLYNIIGKLMKHYPSNSFISKSEGMLRFYFEGKATPEKQNIPECLDNKTLLTNMDFK